MTIMDDIEFFFEKPDVSEVTHEAKRNGHRSMLYSLRREVQDCLLNDNEGKIIPEDQVLNRGTRHRLFATSMVIFSGLDLLAKFYAGTDEGIPVRDSSGRRTRTLGDGWRFKEFIKEHANYSEQIANDLWTYRNCIIHSFGLYDKNNGAQLYVTLRSHSPVSSCAIIENQDGSKILSIEDLYLLFTKIIDSYSESVLNNRVSNKTEVASRGDYQSNFMAMFPKYGYWQYIR